MIIVLLAAPGSGFQNSGTQKEYILQELNNKNIHTKYIKTTLVWLKHSTMNKLKVTEW